MRLHNDNGSVRIASPGEALPRTNALRTALIYLAFFLACAALSWKSGIFYSEFGRYQDEGMHYLTGLFVQDFLTSGHYTQPMLFARQYYLHLPKVALGNWPPIFSLMQTAWALPFGVSRISMMWGMIALTAWLALVVYRPGARYFGAFMGMIGAVLLIAAPLTQQHTAMVMAEIPLATLSFLAVAAFARFLDSGARRDALMFAFWTFVAIMTKGNGWAILLAVPAIVVVTGRFRILRNPWLWISGIVIAVLCVPYTIVTTHVIVQGWDTRTFPGFAYEWLSLRKHLGFVAGVLGVPLTVVAIFGAAYSLLRKTGVRWTERDPFWPSMIVYGAAIVIFHVAIPSSIEPRKIYQIAPVMCLLVLAGIDGISALLPKPLPAMRPFIAAAALLLFAFTGFSVLPQYAPGFGPAVANLMARPESRGAAILISSNPQWADAEAAIIAEWAARRRNDGTYLIRGTKLLGHPTGPDFVADFSDRNSLLKGLSSVPISFVIVHTTEASTSYPFHEQLKAALESAPDDWERIYQSERHLAGLNETHTIEIWRSRKDLAGVPIHYSVDLTRKVGEELSTGP